MMGDISRINWIEHDGVNIGMINDVLRNRFYDSLLAKHAAGQRCIDIGFGTGLLTMMALGHGATHVLAFESDADRWELGRAVIKELGLASKVDLVCERFDHAILTQHPDRVIYTETVNGTLFQEGLINSLPRTPRANFIPSRYFIDLHCVPLSWDLASGLVHAAGEPRTFAPGIDIDVRFVDIINRYYQHAIGTKLPQISRLELGTGLHEFPYQIATAWGYDPHLAIARTIQCSHAGYAVDAETCEITTWNGASTTTSSMDFDSGCITFRVDLPSSRTPLCLVPRAGMAHGKDRLMLDDGHWGPTPSPILCVDIDTVWVSHDLITGVITYSDTRL